MKVVEVMVKEAFDKDYKRDVGGGEKRKKRRLSLGMVMIMMNIMKWRTKESGGKEIGRKKGLHTLINPPTHPPTHPNTHHHHNHHHYHHHHHQSCSGT